MPQRSDNMSPETLTTNTAELIVRGSHVHVNGEQSRQVLSRVAPQSTLRCCGRPLGNGVCKDRIDRGESVASFIAAQRNKHGVPYAKTCRWFEVTESTFYEWLNRPPTPRAQRRAELDAAVRASSDDSDGTPGICGSPRFWEDLCDEGWQVSVSTVVASMARQGLVARPKCSNSPGSKWKRR